DSRQAIAGRAPFAPGASGHNKGDERTSRGPLREPGGYFSFSRWNSSHELRSTQLCSSFPSSRTSHTAVPVSTIGRWSGAVLSSPLFLPVIRHREATRLPSSFWKVSTASNSRSVIVPMNRAAHSLNAALETTSTPPVVRTKSSTTNPSIASGSRTFQTAAQNSSTTLTESLLPIFALLAAPLRIRQARRLRSEGRDDPCTAIFVEPLEEAFGCVRVPRETGTADLAERQHDVVLDGEH